MKIRRFLPFLLIVFAFLLATSFTYAQEVLPDTLIEEEEMLPEEEMLEEEIFEEEIPEEEVMEEEVIEEEMIEEEVPEEEIFEEEFIEEEVVEEEIPEEVVEEEVSTFRPGWIAKAYINGGPIEPWGDPGTGAMFNMGFKGQLGAQLNIGNWVNLPVIFKPLTAEIMVGYTMFNGKDWAPDNKTSLISVVALGRYDVTDLILNLIGFEYPALGIFGVAGFQYNSQSWEIPNREFDPVGSFGLNLGLGVKYNLQSMVGKPVEIDLRFTQGVFIMGDVVDQDGNPFYTDDDYNHTENGVLIGIAYPF